MTSRYIKGEVVGTCSWVDEGITCGDPGETYYNFMVCENHKEKFRSQVECLKRTTALQTSNYHTLDKFPGFCYIVLLPDGSVKIGYSNTEKLLSDRFKSLTRTYGAPVVPLRVIPGGFVAEAVLHNKFEHLRLPGMGERFQYGPDIAEFVTSDALE